MFEKFFNKQLRADLGELNSSHNALVEMLDQMNTKRPGMQSRRDLMLFPELVWININRKVKVRRKKMRFGEYLVFDGILKEGGAFFEHFHDDSIESTEVISGSLKDVNNNNKVYKQHDVMHFEKNRLHTIVALEDTELNIIFKP